MKKLVSAAAIFFMFSCNNNVSNNVIDHDSINNNVDNTKTMLDTIINGDTIPDNHKNDHLPSDSSPI